MKETMKVGIGQTPQLCQDALIEMLRELFAGKIRHCDIIMLWQRIDGVAVEMTPAESASFISIALCSEHRDNIRYQACPFRISAFAFL